MNEIYSPREKEKKRDNFPKASVGTLSCGHFLLIYRNLVYELFTMTLIIIYISTNIDRPYMCDHLGPYISLVYKSVDPMIPYWSIFINYLH